MDFVTIIYVTSFKFHSHFNSDGYNDSSCSSNITLYHSSFILLLVFLTISPSKGHSNMVWMTYIVFHTNKKACNDIPGLLLKIPVKILFVWHCIFSYLDICMKVSTCVWHCSSIRTIFRMLIHFSRIFNLLFFSENTWSLIIKQ